MPSADAPTSASLDADPTAREKAVVAGEADADAPTGDPGAVVEADADAPGAQAAAAAVVETDAGAPTGVAAGTTPSEPGADGPAPTAGRAPDSGDRPPRRAAGAPGSPRAVAPRGFPRAERPGNVPVPQHHHLPGWVRRDYARIRPALADLLGLLQGEDKAVFQRRLEELTEGISSGKFSLAFQYPQVVEEGRKLYEGQREHIAEFQRAQRQLEGLRRHASDKLREAAEVLGPEAAGRLNRALRSAGDAGGISEVEAEAQRALGTARSTQTRRRDKEIEKTRTQIRRTLPKAVVEEPQAETWQDVLRRFAEEQKATAGSEG